jgi:hypothetical protein
VPLRTSAFVRAVFFVFCSAFFATRIASANRADAEALVVLIGHAGNSSALEAVLRELLEREDVAPTFERKQRFRTSALLATRSQDARVWVFIVADGSKVVRLYFRGPFGNRFLLRKLELKNGLDEVGRESIAQVVETSILTLLRSEVGLSREQVAAGITASGSFDERLTHETAPSAEAGTVEKRAPVAAPVPPAEAPHASRRSELELLLAARGALEWTGSDLGADHGVGAETGLAWRFDSGLFVRGRLVLEYGFGQAITTPALSATVRSTALRAGIDLGSASGSSAFAVGIGLGVDLARITPEARFDASLALADTSTASIPVARLEARYELTSGIFRMSAGLFGDASLVDTHYDIRRGNTQERIAAPWMVRPGLFLALGFCPGL